MCVSNPVDRGDNPELGARTSARRRTPGSAPDRSSADRRISLTLIRAKSARRVPRRYAGILAEAPPRRENI